MNISYIIAELSHRPGRTLAGIMAVAIGIALFLSLQSYAGGYRAAARAPLTVVGTDVVAQRQGDVPNTFEGIVFPHSTAPIHRDEIEAIRQEDGVEAISEAVLFWSFEEDRFLVGLGFDPEQTVGPGRLRSGLVSGRFLTAEDRDVAIADATYAAQNEIVVGSELTFSGQTFTIVGLVDTSRAGQIANANIYLPIADVLPLAAAAPNVRDIFDFRPDDANILFIQADAVKAPAIAEQVGLLLGDKSLVTTPDSFDDVLGPMFALIDRFGLLVGLAGLVIAAASLMRTTASSIWERRRDIGLMRTVGWRRREIVQQLMAEGIVTAGLGSVIGVVIAAVVSWGLSLTRVSVPIPWELSPTPHFLPGGAEEMAITVALDANISAVMAGSALALGLITGAMVSFWLARRAAQIQPAELWRYE
jgi:ABC-type antimicrobial peptide transport system permease subunit